uniref:Galectin n=1 Tax=Culex pipiens TaxID=7175 RepID=A0A8D8B631_CULPI
MPNSMQSCSFKMHPIGRTLGDGDELELKGNLQHMDTCFSVNFRFGSGIAYHFGVRLHEEGHLEVFQGYKDDALPDWEEHEPEDWSSEDAKMDITFRLSGEEILVLVDGEKHFETFESRVPLDQIISIELMDDINWVEEIKLKFNTNEVE